MVFLLFLLRPKRTRILLKIKIVCVCVHKPQWFFNTLKYNLFCCSADKCNGKKTPIIINCYEKGKQIIYII